VDPSLASPTKATEMPPAVSFIVPNYNHALYLPQRLDSILEQTYQDFELILLDDCSTDNSREILQDYAKRDGRIRCEFNETHNDESVAVTTLNQDLTHNESTNNQQP